MNEHTCLRYSPRRRRYAALSSALAAAEKLDVEVRRCEERLGGCGGWHLPEGMDYLTHCPTPEKRTFDKEWEAEQYLEMLRTHLLERLPDLEGQRVYACRYQPRDGRGGLTFHYHLTSQPEEMSNP